MAGRAKAIQWILDWLELGDVEQSDANIGDPIDIATKAGTALVALLALPSSQLVTLIVPEMNSNALIVFQVLIGLVTLGVIKLQRFRIAESFLVFHWPAMHNLADSEFDDLAGGARNIDDLDHLGRHVTR